MLVAPGSAHIGLACNLKYRVDFQVLIGVYWFASQRINLRREKESQSLDVKERLT